LDDTRARERGESLGQEIARDPRKSELDLAEAMAAVQKLAQDERRPALGEDLSPTRYRAELRVMRHVPSQHLTPLSAQVHFLVFQRVHDTSIVPDGRKAPGRYGNMRIRFVLALLVVVATVAAYGGTELATPKHGVTSTLCPRGMYNVIDHKKTTRR